MNIYHNMNNAINYIEENLQENIDYKKIAQILGVNEYTTKIIFNTICEITITEYIRNRRLSNAAIDLCTTNNKIIDISIEYGYDNPTSFSRAFTKFHGIKPSEVRENKNNLKVYPKIEFLEKEIKIPKMEYSIIERKDMVLYGEGIKTTYEKIEKDAPTFFKKMIEKYGEKYGHPDYGMIVYEDRFESENYEYWILYERKIEGLQKYKIKGGKYLKFIINSQVAKEIRKVSQDFYKYFVSSCKYNLRELPELEYYHNDITDFLVPIED